MIEEIKNRVEEKMSKLLRIKKLKKKVLLLRINKLKFKKRCKKYKKLIIGLRDQLAAPTERVEILVGLDIFNMLELSIVNAGDVYSGLMHLHLKKKEMSNLKLSINNPINIQMPTTDNPLSLILQAETLAEYLGIKLKIGGLLAATDIVGVTESKAEIPVLKTTAPVVVTNTAPPIKKEAKVEATKNIVQPSSPAIPVKEKAPQQNPK